MRMKLAISQMQPTGDIKISPNARSQGRRVYTAGCLPQVSDQLWDASPTLWWQLLGDAASAGMELQSAHVAELQVCNALASLCSRLKLVTLRSAVAFPSWGAVSVDAAVSLPGLPRVAIAG